MQKQENHSALGILHSAFREAAKCEADL